VTSPGSIRIRCEAWWLAGPPTSGSGPSAANWPVPLRSSGSGAATATWRPSWRAAPPCGWRARLPAGFPPPAPRRAGQGQANLRRPVDRDHQRPAGDRWSPLDVREDRRAVSIQRNRRHLMTREPGTPAARNQPPRPRPRRYPGSREVRAALTPDDRSQRARVSYRAKATVTCHPSLATPSGPRPLILPRAGAWSCCEPCQSEQATRLPSAFRLSRRFHIPEGAGRGQGVVCPFSSGSGPGCGHAGRRTGVKVERPAGRTTLTPVLTRDVTVGVTGV